MEVLHGDYRRNEPLASCLRIIELQITRADVRLPADKCLPRAPQEVWILVVLPNEPMQMVKRHSSHFIPGRFPTHARPC